MINYIIGALFLIVFSLLLYTLGTAVIKNTENSAYNFIIGYIIYSFLVAVGGVGVQILKLPYIVFFIYMLLLLLGILIFSLKCIKKENIDLFPKNFIKNHWFILILVVLLVFLSLGNIEYFWMGNNLDDGFYLNKVATYASIGNIHNQVPATGLPDYSLISLYSINSWEIEASFYVKILNMDPVVYLRFVLATFQYLVLALTIMALAKKMNENSNLKEKYYQFFSAILMFFSFIPSFIEKFIFLQDGWQFNSAMYYGSAIVRTGGLLLLILPIIDKEKIDFKLLTISFMTSVVLISKSTVAIPLIFAVAVGYFLNYLIKTSNRTRLLSIIFILLLIAAGIVLKNKTGIEKTVLIHLKTNIKSIILYISTAILLFALIFSKNKIVKSVILVLIITAIMLYINPLNDIIENLSQYKFVAARMQACLFQTIIILAFILIIAFILTRIRTKYFAFLGISCCVFGLFTLSLYGYYRHYGSIVNAYKILYKSKTTLPNGTVNLGKTLEKLYSSKGKVINAMVPEGTDTGDGYTHSLAVLLRTYAPHTRVITATGRFGVKPGNEFSDYFQTDTQDYYNYMTDPYNQEYKNKMSQLLKKYPINCIVTPNKDLTNELKEYNYNLYNKTCDDYGRYCYYVYDLK